MNKEAIEVYAAALEADRLPVPEDHCDARGPSHSEAPLTPQCFSPLLTGGVIQQRGLAASNPIVADARAVVTLPGIAPLKRLILLYWESSHYSNSLMARSIRFRATGGNVRSYFPASRDRSTRQRMLRTAPWLPRFRLRLAGGALPDLLEAGIPLL